MRYPKGDPLDVTEFNPYKWYLEQSELDLKGEIEKAACDVCPEFKPRPSMTPCEQALSQKPLDDWMYFLLGVAFGDVLKSWKGDNNAEQVTSNPEEETHEDGEEHGGEGNADREKGSGEGNEVVYVEGNGPDI